MRATFGGITYGGVRLYAAILATSGSGTLTFTTTLATSTTIRLGGRGQLRFPGNSTQVDWVPVRVMALTSGISADSQRYAYQADLEPAGADLVRPGLLASGAAMADLVKVTALQAKITPFQAFVSGAGPTQPGYIVTNDEDTYLTFGAGSGTDPRIDLVVVRVRDDVHDGSGVQAGTVEVLAGTPAPSPVAPAVPTTAIPLWQVLVPGSVTGAVGLDFATARTDRRPWTTAIGGILPVASEADRNAVANPYEGMAVWRTDTKWREVHDGTYWRVKGPIAVPNTAALPLVTNPYDGQVAVSFSDNDLLQWDEATLSWVSFVKAALPVGYAAWPTFVPTLTQQSAISNTPTARYWRAGNIVWASVTMTVTATGVLNQVIQVGLPLTALRSTGAVGRGYIYDVSANTYRVGTVLLDTTTKGKFAINGTTVFLGLTGSGLDILGIGDVISYTVAYEAA